MYNMCYRLPIKILGRVEINWGCGRPVFDERDKSLPSSKHLSRPRLPRGSASSASDGGINPRVNVLFRLVYTVCFLDYGIEDIFAVQVRTFKVVNGDVS